MFRLDIFKYWKSEIMKQNPLDITGKRKRYKVLEEMTIWAKHYNNLAESLAIEKIKCQKYLSCLGKAH